MAATTSSAVRTAVMLVGAVMFVAAAVTFAINPRGALYCGAFLVAATAVAVVRGRSRREKNPTTETTGTSATPSGVTHTAVKVVPLLIAAIATVLSATLLFQGVQDARPPVVVTAPITSTAQLEGETWTVRDEIILDQAARDGLRAFADHFETPLPDKLQSSEYVLDGTWTLDRVVDGNPVFTRIRTEKATVHRLQSETNTLATPTATYLTTPIVARDGSTFSLSAPRLAIYGTEPSGSGEKSTADRKTWVTEVAYGEPTSTIKVGLSGTWLRSPLGAKLNDLASWGWWPLLLSLAVTAAVPALRKRLWGWLRLPRERLARHPWLSALRVRPRQTAAQPVAKLKRRRRRPARGDRVG